MITLTLADRSKMINISLQIHKIIRKMFVVENVISIILPSHIVKNKIIFIKEKLWIILLIPMDVEIFEITLQIDIIVEKIF